jgi:hypothetical protein
MPVTDLGDTDGWTAEPVDHDPFASDADSFANSVARNNPIGLGGLGGVAGGATGEPYAQPEAAAAPGGSGPLGRSGAGGGEAALRPAPGEAAAPPLLSVERARANAAAGPYQAVAGLPQKPLQFPDGSLYQPGPLAKAHQAAEAYMRESGLPYDPPRDYAKIDKNFGARVAQAYEDMPHAPDDPAVKASYNALARETMAQWQHVKGTGLQVDWITPETGDPYAANPRMAIKDIRDNNHWWGYPTDEGYGSTGEDIKGADNPMLADSGEEIGGHRARVNDIFRIVHDYFGHAKEGHGFRAEGEDNAFRSHATMYSDAAKPAMTSELRGQNSWLNFGPYGEQNRTAKAADTVFADQKIGVMPEWTWREGAPMPPISMVGRPPVGLGAEEEALQRQREAQGEWTGGRIGFADGGAPDDLSAFGQMKLEPVDGDPFAGSAPQPSDFDRAYAKARWGIEDQRAPAQDAQPQIMGHVAASPVPGQNLTPKYLAARPEGSISSYDPSWAEKVQQGVSEGAQAVGVPTQGAERMGSAVRTGAEYAPGTSNIISANEAYRAGQRGDYLGAAVSALGAVPIPGAGTAERAGVGVIERGADGILRHADSAFPEGRIATTMPWSKKLPDPHQSGEGTIGHDTLQASGDMYPKTADIIKEMPYTGVKTKVPAQDGKKAKTTTTWTPTGDLNIPADATPEEAHEAFIEHAKSNILALHDAVPDDIRQGSMQWYDGANTIAKQRAQQYDRPLENIAGTYAALSPQMDWYKNASLGDRVMDISTRQGNTAFSPEMQSWVGDYLKSSSSKDTAKSAAIYDAIKDKPLGQITDPLERAHWIRAYDEAHNDRAYNLVNPDGTFGPPVQTKGGANAGAGWGSMDAIANAVTAFDGKDMPTISEAMGAGHKVRNFYNNILNPNAATGDVTVDTHAIAAALLRPLSGSDKDTAIGLGTAPPTNAMTGAKGLYGAYAEAYRRAAEERGILPRQMQSITWEAIRGLYNPAEKRSASFRRAVDEAWANHRTGNWTQQQVQQHLMVDPETGASRIRPPSWYSGAPEIETPD